MASDTAGTGIPGSTDPRDADLAAAGAAGNPASRANGQPNGRAVLRPAEARLLERELAATVDGEVRFDDGTRAAYSTDASNFRQVPIGVVLPRTVDAAVAAVDVCRRHAVPLLSRGGGTSLAGQCTNTAVVIDWTKYCRRVLDVDRTRAPARWSRGSCSTCSTTSSGVTACGSARSLPPT
jgi:FAD/FMN-containing dehydrogenase